jgi:hypothetical protein
MWITRRVMAILAVLATLFLATAPANAERRADGGLVEVGLDDKVVQLVADGDSTCALTEAGEVYCWGASYPEPYRPGVDPLLIVTLGALLIAGGATLLTVTRS